MEEYWTWKIGKENHYGKPLICRVSHVCREQENGHTAKRSFAVCPRSNTRQTKGTRRVLGRVLGKKTHGKIIHTANSKFCRVLCARHTANTWKRNGCQDPVTFAVCPTRHSANQMCCRVHIYFAVCLCPSTRQSNFQNCDLAIQNFSDIHLLHLVLDVNI